MNVFLVQELGIRNVATRKTQSLFSEILEKAQDVYHVESLLSSPKTIKKYEGHHPAERLNK
jgi:hypothetical protein